MNITTNLSLFRKLAFVYLCFNFIVTDVAAQLPVCSATGGLIYFQSGNSIYNYNPLLPITPANPVINSIPMPSGSGGLAVSPNINAATPSPTFYTTVGAFYYYYNGGMWINTGHSSGPAAAVNPGAGGGYIYNLIGASGEVWKYDGTGPATLVLTIASFGGGGPYDITCDCAGNFYILRTTTPQYMNKYSPAGVLLQSYTLTGAPSSAAGGGFAIIDNNVYYNNGSGFVSGTILGSNINFTSIAAGLSPSPGDFACCPIGGISSVQASIDTGYYCGSGPGVPVSALGTGPFTWTVISGNAVITGSGTNVTITATTTSRIVLGTTAASLCGSSSTDTVTIIPPKATVDAGLNDTLLGCGTYTGSLQGSVYNTTPGVTYNYNWTPGVTSGGNTLTPVINPVSNTTYTLTVSSPANQGGCTWSDTVKIAVKNVSVTAGFNFNIKYGCGQDTVTFTNTSSPNTISAWDFGDNTGDTARNPVHVYNNQNTYNVKLMVTNGQCKDSVTLPVDITHPLDAAFTVDDDSVCMAQLISFTDASTTTTKFGINPTYYWDFGDGTTSINQNPTHIFSRVGIYNVMMVVKDFVPCTDTAWKIVVVDSIPHAYITLSDTIICAGKSITFNVDFLNIGIKSTSWNFGDGTTITGAGRISHSFDVPGTYTIRFDAEYRICPDTFDTHEIEVMPYPVVNLGPDTSICPGSGFIRLADEINKDNPAARYLWSNGATTFSILTDKPGVYQATVWENGCSATDSIEVFNDCYINVPNTFTPNGDGINDYFFPRNLLSSGLTSFKFTIYNRWGQVIFETSNANGRGWDGRFNDQMQPQGVYIYTIEAKFVNGRNENMQGNLTLLQ